MTEVLSRQEEAFLHPERVPCAKTDGTDAVAAVIEQSIPEDFHLIIGDENLEAAFSCVPGALNPAGYTQ